MQDRIAQLEKTYLQEIQDANSLQILDQLFLKAFGKNGEVTVLPKDFPQLPKDQLQTVGPLFNKLKTTLEQTIEQRRQQLREDYFKEVAQEEANFSPVEIKQRQGYLHPLTRFEKEIADLFGQLGFQHFAAPHIDTDYFNFEVLNIPPEHPARDLWDTLYLDKSNINDPGTVLLRTHTSNSQVRVMQQFELPVRMMVMDRCFRYENLDARHEHTFDQFELVYVDKGLNMANLQYLSEYFLKTVLGDETEVRMRPKYYPFVEPGVGIDGTCIFCKGKGCKVCSGIGWLELAGAGMIHPQVLRNGGIDPEKYTGIAWGPGLERIMMLKYGVNDLRLFRNGDLTFLQGLKI